MERSRDLTACKLCVLLVVGAGGWFVVPARAEESLAERQTRVEAMSPAKKEELARRQERFDRLDPEEQQHLVQLDRQLRNDTHSQELRRIMHRYYRWVTTLPRYEQRALLDMPASERLGRVRQLLDEQARRAKRPNPASAPPAERARRWLLELGISGTAAAKRPTEEDLKPLQSWLEQYLERHGTRAVDRLPDPQARKVRSLLDSTKEPQRRKTILMTVWLQLQMQRPPSPPGVSDKELATLHDQLAPELRQRLAELPPAEQRRMTLTWMRLAALHQIFLYPEPALPLVAEEELARFFEEKLDPRDRDRLLTLPAEDMDRELLLAYLRSRLIEERPRPPQQPSSKRESTARPNAGRPQPSKNGK